MPNKQESTTATKNFWPGYLLPRTWGKWFIINWPDVHPDTHCDAGKFTPEKNMPIRCSSCGWIPADAICPDCGETRRDEIEMHVLKRAVRQSPFSNILITGYQAYVDEHRIKLTAPPTFEEVQKWWNKLPDKDTYEFIHTYGSPESLDSSLESLLRMLASSD